MNIPAKNGNNALFQLGAVTLPDGSQAQAIVLIDATGNPITSWPLSTDAATETGNLAAILEKLNGTLAVTGSFYPATQQVAGTVEVTGLPTDYPDAATKAAVNAVLARLPATPHEQPLTDAQLRGGAPLLVQGNFYPATQPVSLTSIPLNSNAATAAKQDEGNTFLDGVLTQVSEVRDRLPAAGVASDASLVSILAKIITAPATEAKQDAEAVLLTAIRDKLPAVALAQGVTDAQLRAAPIQNANTDDSFLTRWVLKPLSRLTFSLTGLRVDCGGSSVSASIAANQDLRNITGTLGVVGAIGYNTQLGQSIQQSNVAFQTGFRRNLSIS